MPDADVQLRQHLERFLEEHEQRRKTPIFGTRKADEALLALCEHFKTNRPALSEAAKDEVLRTLGGMDLKPYRAYCREHLLDIGITNV